ncbi:hypothetical protein ABZ942_42390 [Nocardia sp. NPDC046473]|uniref:hypothetical protein n=1 Tax=Nocardia sp. NPDC046473 TaxID=3155733 RepID=UPI0033E7AC73
MKHMFHVCRARWPIWLDWMVATILPTLTPLLLMYGGVMPLQDYPVPRVRLNDDLEVDFSGVWLRPNGS